MSRRSMSFEVYRGDDLVTACATEAEAFETIRVLIGSMSATEAVWLDLTIVKVDRRGRTRKAWSARAIVGRLFEVQLGSLYSGADEVETALDEGHDFEVSMVPQEGHDLRGWWALRLSFMRVDPQTGVETRERIRFRFDHSREALEPALHEMEQRLAELGRSSGG